MATEYFLPLYNLPHGANIFLFTNYSICITHRGINLKTIPVTNFGIGNVAIQTRNNTRILGMHLIMDALPLPLSTFSSEDVSRTIPVLLRELIFWDREGWGLGGPPFLLIC